MARDYDGGNTTGFVSPASDSLEGQGLRMKFS